MQLAHVIGNATATVKHASLVGQKLLIVQPLRADARSPDGDPLLVVDTLGAGPGQRVLVTSDGHLARQLLQSETTPVRWTSLGIKD